MKLLSMIIIPILAYHLDIAAQNMTDMLDGNPIWVYRHKNSYDRIKDSFSTFYLNGDTILNGKRYKKLYVKYTLADGTYIADECPLLDCYVRSEANRLIVEKKFYISNYGRSYSPQITYYDSYFGESEDEVIIYDFDELGKSDSIGINISGKQVKYKVGHDKIQTGLGLRFVSYVYYGNISSVYSEIIEGIGSVNRSLIAWVPTGQLPYTSSLETVLNVYIQNGQIVYKAPEDQYVEVEFIDELLSGTISDILSLYKNYSKHQTRIYNIQGHRLGGLQHGININEGKKVLVK